jgi:hypothetical protein
MEESKEQKWSKEETESKERQLDNNQQKCGRLLHAFCRQFAIYKMVNGLEDKSFAHFCKRKHLKGVYYLIYATILRDLLKEWIPHEFEAINSTSITALVQTIKGADVEQTLRCETMEGLKKWFERNEGKKEQLESSFLRALQKARMCGKRHPEKGHFQAIDKEMNLTPGEDDWKEQEDKVNTRVLKFIENY